MVYGLPAATAAQLEHGFDYGVKARRRDAPKLAGHRTEFAQEIADDGVIEGLLPVERR